MSEDMGASPDGDRATAAEPEAVSALRGGIPCACNFCGATNKETPGRVLEHDNGSAICADCVAAAVLSLARYAQELVTAQGIPTEGGDALAAPFMGSPVAESHAPEAPP